MRTQHYISERLLALGLMGLGALLIAIPFLPPIPWPKSAPSMARHPRFYLGPQTIETNNPNLRVNLYLHYEDATIRLVVSDPEGKLIWERTVPSRKILVADQAPVIAILKKSPALEEGRDSVHPFQYEGFMIYSKEYGVKVIQGTGPIQSSTMAPDGTMVVSGNKGLLVYSPKGEELWNNRLKAYSLRILCNGKILEADALDGRDKRTIQLFSLNEGKLLSSITEPVEKDPYLLDFSSDEKQVLISRRINEYEWNVFLYNFPDMAESQLTLSLNGNPRAGVIHPDGKVFAFLMLVPEKSQKKWEYTCVVLSSDGKELAKKSFEQVSGDTSGRIIFAKDKNEVNILVAGESSVLSY